MLASYCGGLRISRQTHMTTTDSKLTVNTQLLRNKDSNATRPMMGVWVQCRARQGVRVMPKHSARRARIIRRKGCGPQPPKMTELCSQGNWLQQQQPLRQQQTGTTATSGASPAIQNACKQTCMANQLHLCVCLVWRACDGARWPSSKCQQRHNKLVITAT